VAGCGRPQPQPGVNGPPREDGPQPGLKVSLAETRTPSSATTARTPTSPSRRS